MAKQTQERPSPKARKPSSPTSPSKPPVSTAPTTADELESRMLVLAEHVGRAIGTVQVTAERLVDRKALSTQLTRVRDQAAQLLEYLSSRRAAAPARRTRAPRSGGTVDAPIFAETASSFTILGADGNVITIDANSPSVNGWSPLQFARVSLGGLGVVTRIVLDVLPRPYATTLQGGTQRYLLKDKKAFIAQFTNDTMDAASFHSYTCSNRIDTIIERFNSYFSSFTRITNNFLDDNKAIKNFRHFNFQQFGKKVRRSS
jgi:hypothetical protein